MEAETFKSDIVSMNVK